MSVREYIGARYVPLFAEPLQWDATRTYEPLTVVLYQGNSYTSRQAVPANIDITNTTYWAQTGNYNAQVEQYRQEVQTFNNRITQNATDISDEETARADADTALGTRITDESEARADADTALETAINNAVATLRSEIGNIPIGTFQGANIMCINDSWGSNNPAYGVTYNWMQMVCASLHANYIDLHLGSTGYINSTGIGGQSGNYLERVQAWVADTSHNPADIDFIFVMGGLNDVGYTKAEVRTAIQNFITYVHDTFTNAIIYLMPQVIGGDPSRISFNSSEQAWAKVASFTYGLNSVTMRRVIFNDKLLYCLVGNPALMSSDMVHPNQEGHNVIASAFLKSISGGSVRAPMYALNPATKVVCNNVEYQISNQRITMSVVDNVAKICGYIDIAGGTANTANAVRIFLKNLIAVNAEDYNTQPCGWGMTKNNTTGDETALEVNFYNIDETSIGTSSQKESCFLNTYRSVSSKVNLTNGARFMFDFELPLVYS